MVAAQLPGCQHPDQAASSSTATTWMENTATITTAAFTVATTWSGRDKPKNKHGGNGHQKH